LVDVLYKELDALMGFGLGTKPKKPTGRKMLGFGYEIFYSATCVWHLHWHTLFSAL